MVEYGWAGTLSCRLCFQMQSKHWTVALKQTCTLYKGSHSNYHLAGMCSTVKRLLQWTVWSECMSILYWTCNNCLKKRDYIARALKKKLARVPNWPGIQLCIVQEQCVVPHQGYVTKWLAVWFQQSSTSHASSKRHDPANYTNWQWKWSNLSGHSPK